MTGLTLIIQALLLLIIMSHNWSLYSDKIIMRHLLTRITYFFMTIFKMNYIDLFPNIVKRIEIFHALPQFKKIDFNIDWI